MQIIAGNRMIDIDSVNVYVEERDVKFHDPRGTHIKPIHCENASVAFALWSVINEKKEEGATLVDLSLYNFKCQ